MISEKRSKEIHFHVDSDDYFGTIATILGLVSEPLAKSDAAKETLTELRDELVYMQEHYKINPKE